MKLLMIFLVIAVLGITLFRDTSPKKINASNIVHKTSESSANEPKIDFIVGSWIGTGFVTDESGLQQYIEIQEDNTKLSSDEYQIVGVGRNPGNNYMITYRKTIYFNAKMNAWYTKGTINENVLHDSHTSLDDNVLSYSFYNLNSKLVRHTIISENVNSFTETQERWEPDGWCKTAWFRMSRNFNNSNSTSRPFH